MPQTTQDFDPIMDLTGLTSLSSSQMQQLVETARPANNKGLIVATKDVALNVPDVPNPNLAFEGVTPVHWKRYVWVRLPYSNEYKPIFYSWHEEKTSHVTFLKWTPYLTEEVALAIQDALDAKNKAAEAITKANEALTAANNATDANQINNLAQQIEALNAKLIGAFNSFDEGAIGGKGRIRFARILETNEVTRTYMFPARQSLLNIGEVGAFAGGSWFQLDLAAQIARFPTLNALQSKDFIVAIIQARVGTGFFGGLVNGGTCTAYFTSNMAYSKEQSFYVQATVARDHAATPTIRVADSCLLEIPVNPQTQSIFYYWESTGEQNTLQVDLLGFRHGLSYNGS